MMLLIDAGNTRIKWAVVARRQWLAQGALLHGEVAQLQQVARQHPNLQYVLCANVAGDALAERISAALRHVAPAPVWLQSSAECCGVFNHYDAPTQLGADRWAALIGARACHAGSCLVVTAGTATTVDVLDAAGHFLGGLILPGERLMRESLAGNTAQLSLHDGAFSLRPRNTADAMASGCLLAQVGAIEHMFHSLPDADSALCLLNGGGAPALAKNLGIPCRPVENLVLHGLSVIACAQPGACSAA